jgi:hypothetical protein
LCRVELCFSNRKKNRRKEERNTKDTMKQKILVLRKWIGKNKKERQRGLKVWRCK